MAIILIGVAYAVFCMVKYSKPGYIETETYQTRLGFVGTANAFIPWILACAAANGTENFAFPKAFWTLFHIKRLLKLFALLDFHMRGAGLHSASKSK